MLIPESFINLMHDQPDICINLLSQPAARRIGARATKKID